MVGKVIKIKEEHLGVVEDHREKELTYRTGYSIACQNIKSESDQFWAFIKEAYPETKGYELMFNHKKKSVTIIGKISEGTT